MAWSNPDDFMKPQLPQTGFEAFQDRGFAWRDVGTGKRFGACPSPPACSSSQSDGAAVSNAIYGCASRG